MPVETRRQAAIREGRPSDEQKAKGYTESINSRHSTRSKASKSSRKSKTKGDGSVEIPTYTINLSLPPEQRYVELAKAYREEIAHLPSLFDEVLEVANFPLSNKNIHRLSRLLLRKVHDEEQCRELEGISKVTGVPMYLLVAFNVLLDLFMGCTSGGVRIQGDGEEESRMVHFRTLDWGMDALREVVVQLNFVEREGGEVIARSVTYVGFVGVLTGVRPGFSLSLNFRDKHHNESWIDTVKYRWHQVCVLLGFKPSIASILRHSLLPPRKKSKAWWGWIFGENPSDPDVFKLWMNSIPAIPSTSCYLIFCNGQDTYVIEKDRKKGSTYDACVLIAATNHDSGDEHLENDKDGDSDMAVESGGHTDHEHDEETRDLVQRGGDQPEDSTDLIQEQNDQDEPVGIAADATSEAGTAETTFLMDTIDESMERKYELYRRYQSLLDFAKKETTRKTTSKVNEAADNTFEYNNPEPSEPKPYLSQSAVERLLKAYPTTNECTHFAVIMDPQANDIILARLWRQPPNVEDLERRDTLEINPRIHPFSEEYRRQLKDE